MVDPVDGAHGNGEQVRAPERDARPDARAEARDEAARRARRTVGFKVMRDLHREARAMEHERRQRPWLVLVLLALIAALGLAAALALGLLP